MGSKSLVICDPEESYAQALALYIMNRKGINFQVQVCSGIEHVTSADILLISDEYPEEERMHLTAGKVLILSGGMSESDSEDVIYKYQSGETILDEILKNESTFPFSQKKSGQIIGVFSPVHRIGKTAYALRMGEEMAACENVLYLNLELYGGIGGHFEKGGQTLEDVLYYSRQEKGNLGFMLNKVVKHRGNLDYVLPVQVSEDIKEIRAGEWAEFMQQILKQSVYDKIILDIDEGIRDVYELLMICSQIHLLTDHSPYSEAKIEQFEKELTMLGYEELLGRIVRKDGCV